MQGASSVGHRRQREPFGGQGQKPESIVSHPLYQVFIEVVVVEVKSRVPANANGNILRVQTGVDQ